MASYIFAGETDSYMYQTVGSQVIEAIASCLDLPLVVHQLAGTCVIAKFYARFISDPSVSMAATPQVHR